MVVAFFVGSISKRFGALTVMRAGLFLSVVGLFLLGFSTSLTAVVILSVIFVAGIAVVSPVIISLISQKGGNARGTAISFNAFVLFLGASAGPIVAVQLLKTGMLTLSFIILSVCLLIGLGVSFFLRSAVSAQGR
ncbi:MFS transporter [Niallia taxi]